MSVPRKRLSKARTGQRKAGALKTPGVKLEKCPECRRPKLHHRACASCGFYKDGIRVKVL